MNAAPIALLGALAVAPDAPPPPHPSAPNLLSFCGVNYLSSPEVMRELGLGWARESFPIDWNAVEPERGRWSWGREWRVAVGYLVLAP